LTGWLLTGRRRWMANRRTLVIAALTECTGHGCVYKYVLAYAGNRGRRPTGTVQAVSRLLVAAVAVVLLVTAAGCGPEKGGQDLSRFAAVSPEVLPAAGR
jgi:hypothetical protein